jgi:two-component system CheB/CheR fusion protein
LPNRQLLSMARRSLRLDLRTALREAVEGRRRVERQHIAVDDEDRSFSVNILVEPLNADPDPLFLVLFNEAPKLQQAYGTAASIGDDDKRYEQLEQELRDTRERLQATVEEYETAVEELKSSNEELQSINEELQSTNEELETSKEELQSVNEELHTVNAELNAKVMEVDSAHGDLRNIFESTQVATVFLDKDLVIRTFTPAVAGIFNVISSDRGRPLTDIANTLDNVDITREIQAVFERDEIIERKVRRADRQVEYLMRIIPYYGKNHGVEGVLVTFIDITALVESDARRMP